jgi:hypothetical protein
MTKGRYKRRANQFKPGNTASPFHRRNQEVLSRKEPVPGTSKEPVPGTSKEPVPGTSKEPVPGTSKEPVPGTSKDLPEPQKQLETGRVLRRKVILNADESLGNRIINLNRLILMMNSVYQAHENQPAQCKRLQLELKNEHKMGLGSKLQFACKLCNHESSFYDTFQPAKSGKGAAINMMLACGLMDMPIGIEKANLLLTAMDIPPPARSHMQKLVNRASETTRKLNEEDMAEKRRLVRQHNIDHGAVIPQAMDLSFDGRYNATRMVSSYKPGQASSQAYGIAIENHTSYKYIVALAVENKLCWTGAYLKNRNFDIKCPGGHAGCTATKEYLKPHSERSMAYDIAKQLHTDDIMVRTLTTDGDTKAHLGMADFYDELGNAWKVSRQADPYHLSNRQFHKARTSQFSEGMFPGLTTREAKRKATIVLAKDIKARSSSIIDTLRTLNQGDVTKDLKRLPEICAATILCYGGNCSRCPHDSLVCSGVGGEGDWWYKSAFLPTNNIHCLKLTENDQFIMATILELRLSESAVSSVKNNTSTQKCEAFNRAALSTMPKDINRSRNFAGVLASKTLQINNSLQFSVKKKVESLTGLALSPKACRYLHATSKRSTQHRTYQRTHAFKIRRHRARARLENQYHRSRNPELIEIDEYRKGQLDDVSHKPL